MYMFCYIIDFFISGDFINMYKKYILYMDDIQLLLGQFELGWSMLYQESMQMEHNWDNVKHCSMYELFGVLFPLRIAQMHDLYILGHWFKES